MKVDGTPETFAEVAEWLKKASEANAKAAKEQHFDSDFDWLRITAIYSKNLAEDTAKAVHRLAVILDERSKGGNA